MSGIDLPFEFARPLALSGPRLGLFEGWVRWFADVTSTNDVALRMAEHGAPEGLVVVADAQTAGRGRHGRTWASPPGAGLYVSALLRPPAHAVPLMTLAAGVAIADGVRAATGLEPALKWPNDLLLGGRKLAGILAEAGFSTGRVPHVIVGFGLNIMPAAYPREIAARATSIDAEAGRPVDRGIVLAECLCALARRYTDLREGAGASILAAWRERARPTLGRRVEWDEMDGTKRGVAEDVDQEGALLIRCDSGVARVISGEVRWVS